MAIRDYIPLYEAMNRRRFKRFIVRTDGKTFTLPTGQYPYKGDASIGTVMQKARKAMEAVKYDDASILVSRLDGDQIARTDASAC